MDDTIAVLPARYARPHAAVRAILRRPFEDWAISHSQFSDFPHRRTEQRPNLSSMRRPRQSAMNLVPAGRGGWRPGAGRKPRPGARVLHRSRGRVPTGCPVHVTVRVRRGIPSLRQRRFVSAFKASLSAGCERDGFRVVHFSVQNTHLHFLVEAGDRVALGRGMKSLGARIGRCANRVFNRSGRVLDGRYHHRVLKTPREVRRALAYVLPNARHHYYERHGRPPPAVQLDRASSAVWFCGWKRGHGPPADDRAAGGVTREVARARTWLLSTGWRRHGLIDPAEVPG